MITGIIYRYTSPSGKSYIGQTVNEEYRRKMWFGEGRYTGRRSKIDKARIKYGKDNFQYDVLFKKEFYSMEEATEILNTMESYYIGLFDTYRHGYNSTLGGDGSRGYRMDETTKKKISASEKGKKKPSGFGEKISKAQKGKFVSDITRKRLSDAKKNNGNKIIQYNINGSYIKTWNNIDEVSTILNVSRESIAGCCRGKSKSAHGYIWKYSSTGIPSEVTPKSRRSDVKGVYQLTMDGTIIREFSSLADAALYMGCNSTNISACCREKLKSLKGYKWRYKDGNL